ncbi:hypothetical protein HCU64_14740 [Methylobacterium sp. C25]|uniref:hypothetical protein n=1 Tax=Methylobacterium sp. C25 TaxID=2721622 RepID=UPI001F1D6860|nr:hypothetical protein [Methylobacterium sp. C25]MCE4225015.1 hypothetical protein [Methylobacterium sp. C25]
MASTGKIIQFPTGETVKHVGPGSVFDIASQLHRKLGRRGALPRRPAALSIRLEALCGVADATIRRLSVLAAAGSITHETAARLALRHAREIGADRSPPSAKIRGVPSVYDLHVAGQAPDYFALRIASGDGAPWIGSAARHSYGKLLRVCPDGSAICLLVGRAQGGPIPVRLVMTPSWQVTMVGRSMRPNWWTLKHILVVGGLPAEPTDDSDVTAAVVAHLRSRPHLRVLPGGRAVQPDAPRDATAIQVVRLLAIALPGLLTVDHHGGRR